MLSTRSRLSAIAIIMGAASIIAMPQPAAAEEMRPCQETGMCCVNSSSCSTGSFCCYFEVGIIQRDMCGCNQP